MNLPKLIASIILAGILIFFIYTLGIYFRELAEKFSLTQQKPPTKFTEQNEPAGFRDLSWGKSLNTVANLKSAGGIGESGYFGPFVSQEFAKLHQSYQRFCMYDYGRLYERPQETLAFGGAAFEHIYYLFVGGNFNGVIMPFKWSKNAGAIKDHLFKQYQPAALTSAPQNSRIEMYRWKGKRTGMALYYDLEHEEGTLMIHLWQKFTAKTPENARKFKEEAIKGEAAVSEPAR